MPKYPTIPELKRRGTIPLIGGTGAAAPFSPSDIAGLQAWWQESGIQTEGSDVTGWNDSSGNAKNLAILGDLAGLSTLNGHQVVHFNTADGIFGTPLNRGSQLMTGTASTTFLVARKDSTWNESGIYTTKLSFQANHHPFSDNAVYDANFSTARKSCGAQVVTIPDNWRIFGIRSQDNSYQMHIDGTLQFSTATNTFALGTDFVIGCGATDGADQNYALLGDIAEVLVYNAFLSDAQLDQVGGYLATRFALTWTP